MMDPWQPGDLAAPRVVGPHRLRVAHGRVAAGTAGCGSGRYLGGRVVLPPGAPIRLEIVATPGDGW